MKKVLAMVLCLAMSFAMVACAGETDAPPLSSAAKKFDEPVATTGTISLEIVKAEVTKDSKDADAVVITYNFINNTNKETSFAKAINATAMQGDKPLAIGIVEVGDVFISGDGMKKIAIGETVEFQKSFVLSDTTTKVTATCKILSGEDKKTVTAELDI